MNKEDFRRIESEEEFVAILKRHNLFREDDVTFDDLEEGNKYVFSGDQFIVDTEMLEELDIGALLIDGSVKTDYLAVSDILPDYGVFCVTGDVHCKDMYYCTESTGVSIGGNLTVEHLFYADCGNAVLQVNGNLNAKVAYVSQCSVEVQGEEQAEFDEGVALADLASMGLAVAGHEDASEAIQAYFEAKQR